MNTSIFDTPFHIIDFRFPVACASIAGAAIPLPDAEAILALASKKHASAAAAYAADPGIVLCDQGLHLRARRL